MSVNAAMSSRASLTEEQVLELVASALGVPRTALNSDSTSEELAAEWDSMGMLALLTALDREGVQLDPGNIQLVQSVSGVLAAFRAAGRLK
jgi:acyl carrier protein